MSNRAAGILGTLVLSIFLAVFTSSALAGNGNGKANGNSDASAAAPGNSANAPGHNKDSASADVSASASAQGSASQNSPTTNGMKPTNNTSKNTSCTTGGGSGSAATCAPSSSNTAAAQVATKDASKRYGNGQTAAQIATSNGAPAGTTIFGPGNSQPHKVAACPNATGHMVDVHAVKHFNSAKCSTSSSTQTQAMTSVNGTTTVTGSTTITAGTKAQGKGLAVGQTGGVLGVTASAGKSGNAGPEGGVLGALTTVGQGTLPFTGFPLWAAVALAAMLIVLGLGLRRTGRATV